MAAEQAPANVDWVQIILSAIGISALVSGSLTALLNYLLGLRGIRKKTETQFVHEKLALYSTFLYHLDKMKYKSDAIRFMHNEPSREERYVFSFNEWDELVKDIDSNISDRYYLLNRKILEKWIWVKELRTHPKSIEIMPELRRMLVKEYNAIIEKYVKGMPDIVPKISPDSEVNITENPEKNDSTPK